jgi:uncharacterized protein (DUF2147 family)
MTMTALLLLAAAQAVPAQSIDGRWTNPAKSVIIQIAPCGEARCGTVEWASEAAQADAHKNAPRLIGTQLLTNMAPASATQWRGRIFVPDKNIRASAKVTVLGPGQIRVAGCAVGGLLCESQVWTKAD